MSIQAHHTSCGRADRHTARNCGGSAAPVFGATFLMAQPTRWYRYWDERPSRPAHAVAGTSPAIRSIGAR